MFPSLGLCRYSKLGRNTAEVKWDTLKWWLSKRLFSLHLKKIWRRMVGYNIAHVDRQALMPITPTTTDINHQISSFIWKRMIYRIRYWHRYLLRLHFSYFQYSCCKLKPDQPFKLCLATFPIMFMHLSSLMLYSHWKFNSFRWAFVILTLIDNQQ